MVLHDGSLIVLTAGQANTLTGLPGLTRLAEGLRNRLCILNVRQRSAPVHAVSLPGVLPNDVFTVWPEHLSAVLTTFAASDGRLLALLPTRHRGLTRVFVGNDFERLIRPGALPLLALPPTGALPPLRRVLFPADFAPRSDAAFTHTLALCSTFGAELHIVHVYGADALLPSETDQARRSATTNIRDLLAIDRELLSQYATRATEAGIPVQTATAESRAHDVINRYANDQAIDLIVMATHGPRTPEDILFGTTTARTICAANVPVLAIPA